MGNFYSSTDLCNRKHLKFYILYTLFGNTFVIETNEQHQIPFSKEQMTDIKCQPDPFLSFKFHSIPFHIVIIMNQCVIKVGNSLSAYPKKS